MLHLYQVGDGGGILTRASVARYVDASGVLQSAASDVLREGHYVGSERVLLLERALTNPIANPEDMTTGYTTSQTSVTANAVAAPDGTTTADKIVESIATATHFLRVSTGQGYTPTSGVPIAASVFAKAAERTQTQLDFSGPATWASGAANPSVQATLTGAGSFTGGSAAYKQVRALGNGWYRAEIGDTPTAVTEILPRMYVRNVNNSYAGDGASGLYVWGLQMEPGYLRGSSYTGTVARAADVYYRAYAPGIQTATYYVKFVESGDVVHAGTGRWYIGAAGNTGKRLFVEANGGHYRAGLSDGTSTVYSALSAATAPAEGQTVELRVVHDTTANTIQIFQSLNSGAEETASASSTLAVSGAWGDTRLYLGSKGGSGVGVSWIVSFKADETVRTLAQMRALSSSSSQFARPSADVSNSGWTPSTGSALYATIDEPVRDDADYVQSSIGAATDTFVVTLGSLASVTTTDGGTAIRYAAGKVDGLGAYATDGDGVELEVEVLSPAGASLSPPQVFTHTLGALAEYEDVVDAGLTLSGAHRVRVIKRQV